MYVIFTIATAVFLCWFFPIDNEVGYYPTFITVVLLVLAMTLTYWLFMRKESLRRYLPALDAIVVLFFPLALFSTLAIEQNADVADVRERFRAVVGRPETVKSEWVTLDQHDPRNFEKILTARKKIVEEIQPSSWYLIRYQSLIDNVDTTFLFYAKHDTVFFHQGAFVENRDSHHLIRDTFRNLPLEFYCKKTANDDYRFATNSLENHVVAKEKYTMHQNNIRIEVTDMNGYKFHFEAMGIYKLIDLLL
jgi:hypothetical protein